MTAPAAPAPDEVLVVDADRPRAPGPRPVVDVAVGVLFDRDGRFLLTTRPPGKAYAGHWEFPGGKVEPGETVEQALRRELQEEIGVTIGSAHPWRVLEADYPHCDSTWPHTQATIHEEIGTLPADAIRKITWENASRLYQHPVPESVQADPESF